MSRARLQQTREPEAGAPRPGLDLAGAAGLDGLEQEIGLLRALAKRAVQTEQDDEVRRLVLVLCGALRLQLILAGQPLDAGRRVVDDVLDDIAREERIAQEEKTAAAREGGRE